MKRTIFSISIALLFFLSTGAQEVTVTASFDSSKIFIGDQTGFTVTVDQPSDINLRLPFFKDTLISNIEIISGPVRDTIISAGDRFKIIEKYIITSFDSGFYEIPPVFAESRNETGLKRFYSEYSGLEVVRVNIAPPDTTAKIFDIVAPYKAPVTFAEVLPWILIGAVIAAALFLLVRTLKKIKKVKVVPETVINSEPAHVIALRELEKLREEKLWQQGETKKYYTRLTEILRQYLENRFGILSLELTTRETLDALVRTGFRRDESYKMLEAVLTGGDLVKFAKYKPSTAENEMHFENSYMFVEKTKESEVQETEALNENKAEEVL